MRVGVQFNQNLFAPELAAAGGESQTIPGTTVPESSLGDLQQKLVALKPQFARVFFNPHQDAGQPSSRASFVKTIEWAQAAGATINITVQSVASFVDHPETGMKEFAALLAELVDSHGITNVRWVTLQNEPNTPGIAHINPPVLNRMYRELDAALLGLGLRRAIRFMAGDLIEGAARCREHPGPALPSTFNALDSDWRAYTNEAYWLTWMEDNMADIVDAYSTHIYWDAVTDMPPHPLKFQSRLETITPASKPFYVTEFGVRGHRPAGAQGPGTLSDGTPVEKSNQAAFQHAWFQIAAAKLGCAGTSKWDAYYAIYDHSPQSYYAIGEPVDDTWGCYPMYHLLWLFTNTIEPNWQAACVAGVEEPWAAVAEFSGHPTGLTIVGLDTRWATRSDSSDQRSSFTVPTGLPRGTKLNLLVWNDDGHGRITSQPAVAVGERGTVTISVAQQGVFALTTQPHPALPSA